MVTVAVLATALAACSGGGNDRSDRDTSGTPSTTGSSYVVADAAVRPLLPTVEDLPPRFTGTPVKPGHNRADSTGGYCGGPDMLARAETQGVVAQGRAHFKEKEGSGPLLGFEVYEFPNDSAAKAVMDATAAGAAACPSFRQRDPAFGDAVHTLKTAAFPFPAVADQTVALRLDWDRAGGRSYVAYVVHARLGRDVVVVTQFGLSANPQLTERLVAAQLDKLSAGVEPE